MNTDIVFKKGRKIVARLPGYSPEHEIQEKYQEIVSKYQSASVINVIQSGRKIYL